MYHSVNIVLWSREDARVGVCLRAGCVGRIDKE